MKELEIPLPRNADCLLIGAMIEKVCVSSGLQVALKTTLNKFAGSTHWHFKNGTDKGTLEITWWPAQLRAWFSIQGGRNGKWIDQKVVLLQESFRTAFSSKYTL